MTLGDLLERTLRGKDDDPSAPAAFTTAQASAAIDEGQRVFAWLTLCLEKTGTVALQPATTFYHLLDLLPDYIAPFRAATANGKLRATRLVELLALDGIALARSGDPVRYGVLGADLLYIYPRPVEALNLTLTYAYSPVALAQTTDSPEIPVAYHPLLADYARYRLAWGQGAQLFAATLPLLERFLTGAAECAARVRARSRGLAYESAPAELRLADHSRLFRAQLPKERK